METKTQKEIAVGVILTVVVAAFIVSGQRKIQNSPETEVTGLEQLDQDSADGSVPAPAATKTRLTDVNLAMAYTKALNTYVNRIEFNNCDGRVGRESTNSMVVKKGDKFMLDNNDPKGHTYKVKTQTFKLGPYTFAIVTARDVGTYQITCDGVGGAQLTVNK